MCRGRVAVSCVRVCSKGYFFLIEILSMELYLFKHLIVKHVFVLVIFEGERYKKYGQYGTFLCHISLGRKGEGLEHFNPVT